MEKTIIVTSVILCVFLFLSTFVFTLILFGETTPADFCKNDYCIRQQPEFDREKAMEDIREDMIYGQPSE